MNWGHAVVQLVKALHYKLDGYRMVSLEVFIDIIFLAAIWGTHPLTGIFNGG
jgi:hypothetical protein